ncbi:ATP-binding protein [Kribbella sp. NPDC050281]|uniref:ATP-binding protein n=1 Tax=Kribbella sp. NPDC050281 TaxID=3155515 RepID=UPI0033EF1C8D
MPLTGGPDADAAQRLTTLQRGLLPALTVRASTGRPFSCCWTRTVANGPIEVRLGIEPAESGAIPYPVGARVVAADSAEFPHWVNVDGVHDVLSALPEVDVELTGTLEDLVEALPAEPFAWLVLASPVDVDERAELLDDLHLRMTIGLDREKVSAREALELERSRARYRDFSAAPGGLWSVQVLTGAAEESIAHVVARTLAGAADLHATSYTLAAGATPSRFQATGELLAAIARPPVREIAGVRAIEQVRFDLTPETPPDGIPLGEVLDAAGRVATTMTVSLDTLNRHALVTGATGSGKSQTIRHLLEGLTKRSVPWLVIEPAKAEYAAMAGRLGPDAPVAVIRLGDPDAIPLSLNPLEPEAGFPLQTHLDLVRALFLAAFEAHEPFPQVLSQALTRSYTSLGWDIALSRPARDGRTPQYPTLADVQSAARSVIDDIGYGAELAADVRGFVDVRLASLLLGTPGRFLGAGHPLDIADLLSRNVVLELEDVGDDQDKAFCMGIVLIRLIEHLRVRSARDSVPPGLRHITVVEEAHRLLKASTDGTTNHAVEMFAGLLAEIRAYGEGIIVAEQIPSKVIPDVVKNSALKILHRLPAADDRETVGATMNLTAPQSRAVVSLPPGQAALFTDGMDRPVLIRVPHGEPRERRLPSPPTVTAATRRTRACGASCQDRPCTLRDIAGASRYLDRNPRFVVWVELLTVAHLAGVPKPLPPANLIPPDVPARLAECAIAEATTRAVKARVTTFDGAFEPVALIEHLTEVVTGVVTRHEPVCPDPETKWQAGAFRFADVADALRTYVGPVDVLHPSTEEWSARGLNLEGSTIADQVAGYLALRAAAPSPSLLFGEGGLLRAAAQLSTAAEPHTQIIDASRTLTVPGNWHRQMFLSESTRA